MSYDKPMKRSWKRKTNKIIKKGSTRQLVCFQPLRGVITLLPTGVPLGWKKLYIGGPYWYCMTKNLCNKTRDRNDPYEVWQGPAGFEWRVLKKYQNAENEAKNPYARWFCAVKSNYTYGEFELGDVYVSEIKDNGVKVKQTYPIVVLQLRHVLNT